MCNGACKLCAVAAHIHDGGLLEIVLYQHREVWYLHLYGAQLLFSTIQTIPLVSSLCH